MRKVVIVAAVAVLLAVVLLNGKKIHRWLRAPRQWTVGIYEGPSPLELVPAEGVENPVMAPRLVTDIRGRTCADPFLVRDGGTWYLFFEVIDKDTGRGCVGLASSPDARHWTYRQVVLREPFHMSYPHVFRDGAAWYMIPESQAADSIRLYRADPFPTHWTLDRVLLPINGVDSSIVKHDGLWWLFVRSKSPDLRLFYAPDVHGPWTEHPQSPVVRNDRRYSRCGGRIVDADGRLIRFAQDGSEGYGTRVWAMEITTLTTNAYAEHVIGDRPVVEATGSGWNASGMHQVDAERLDDGRWIACVDGRGPVPQHGRGVGDQ